MTIDTKAVLDVILKADASPMARELASPLVDAYIERFDTFPDSHCRTVAVEVPWRLWLDTNTLVIGVMDRIFEDDNGFVGHEHKTKAEPRKKKDGGIWAGSTEDDWLAEIVQGIQVGVYALALRDGFFGPEWNENLIPFPRMMVRACLKSNPPEFWPLKSERGIFSFSPEYLNTIADAFRSRAAQIRAARKTQALPWQLPGLHCTNKYRRDCEFLPMCRERTNPTGPSRAPFDVSDPAHVVCEKLDLDVNDPELVILSASLYQTSCQCAEKYRIIAGSYRPKESTLEQEIGTVYHAALAEIYRQHMEGK